MRRGGWPKRDGLPHSGLALVDFRQQALFEAADLRLIADETLNRALKSGCNDETFNAVAASLDKALLQFLVGAIAFGEFAPAARRDWAQNVEKHARTLLSAFGIEKLPDDQPRQEVADLFAEALTIDPDAASCREDEFLFLHNISRASSLAFNETDPGFGEVERALHAVRFLALLAVKTREINSVPGKSEPHEYITLLVAATMSAFSALTGKRATVTTTTDTSPVPNIRQGRWISFTQSVLELCAQRVVERRGMWRAEPQRNAPEDFARALRELANPEKLRTEKKKVEAQRMHK